MNGWMAGGRDGGGLERTGRRADGQVGRQTDGRIDGWMDG